MFQNRYLGPSIARIALRPAGAGVATVSPDIKCGPAGFGVAKFPVAIPRRHQGKTVTFEIGVDAEYPHGKGREVRFRNGRTIRHNSRFRSLAVVVQGMLNMLVGHFFIPSPARIRLTLPTDVAEDIPDSAAADSQVLWGLRRTNRCATRCNGKGPAREQVQTPPLGSPQWSDDWQRITWLAHHHFAFFPLLAVKHRSTDAGSVGAFMV